MAESPEVKVRLTAEDQGVAAAIRQLGAELKNLKQTQDQTASSSLKLGEAFKYLVEAIAIERVVEFGKEILDTAVKIGNLSDETGISSRALSAFHHVAEETGISFDLVARSLGMAAKNVTLFEGGDLAAARAMKLLNLTQKDFIGLNADQKITKLVAALAKMPEGFQKNAAAQLLFNRGGRDMIVVANAMAAQGFDKIEDSLTRMGVMMDKDFTDHARIAKAAMHELEDVGSGMAVQFEAGLLPAIADVSAALVENRNAAQGDASAFVIMGKAAGAVGKGIVFAFELIGSVFEQIGSDIELVGGIALSTLEAIGRTGFITADILRGHFRDAWNEIRGGAKSFESDFTSFWDEQKNLVAGNKQFLAGLFPSAEEEKKRIDQWKKDLALGTSGTEGPVPDLTNKAKVPPIVDAAAKAQLALTLKQQQDLLTVWKAGAAQREEVDKEEYEKGTLSLKAYFDRRRTEIQEETAKEIAVLKQERDQVQAAADLAGQQSVAKKTAAGKAATPEAKQTLLGQADRLAAEQLNQLARVDELTTRIATMEIESRTKITALDADQYKTEESNKQKIIEFLKEIDELQHKTVEGSKEEIEAKTASMRVVLEQAGMATKEIDSLLAKYTQLKTSAAQFAAQEKSTQEGILALENQRRAIEIQLKDSVITKEQAEKRVQELLTQEIPILMKQAQLELQIAQASGDQQRIAQAQQTIQQIQNMGTQINKLAVIGKQVSAGLTNDFTNFFQSIPKGTRGMIQAFGQMELSVIRSLENVAAQMLANLLVGDALTEGTKLNDAKTAAANVYAQVSAIPVIGWILAPAAAAAAFAAVLAFEKGGVVPGSGSGDTVPAMLAPREMVLPAGISAGLTRAINTGSIARPSDFRTPNFNVPALSPSGAGMTHNDNRSYTAPVTVHNSKMTPAELGAAVRLALRLGY